MQFNDTLATLRILVSSIEIIFPLLIIMAIVFQILQRKNSEGKLLKYKKVKIYLFVTGIFLGFISPVSDALYTLMIRNAVKDILQNEITSTNKLYVNKNLYIKKTKILKELERMKTVAGHHSAAGEKKRYMISIEYRDQNMSILLKEDDKRKKEYWAYTNYFSDHYEYMGRILDCEIEAIVENESNYSRMQGM